MDKRKTVDTKKRTPYQRIIRAANRGTGCRLTANDVYELSFDTAIVDRAWLDDAGMDGLDG